MIRMIVLAIAAAFLLSGCVDWMYHDRDMGRGRQGMMMGNPDSTPDGPVPCRTGDRRRINQQGCE